MSRQTLTTTSVFLILGPAALTAHAEVYLSVEEAAKVIFPSDAFSKKKIVLTIDEISKIEELSNTKVKSNELTVLVSSKGNFVFLDQVIGKHEQISYAVGIAKSGNIEGVEILEYRESYGHQIRREQWRNQFKTKNKDSLLRLNQDIKNISGATLSSNHVTDGVRKILQTYEVAKKRL